MEIYKRFHDWKEMEQYVNESHSHIGPYKTITLLWFYRKQWFRVDAELNNIKTTITVIKRNEDDDSYYEYYENERSDTSKKIFLMKTDDGSILYVDYCNDEEYECHLKSFMEKYFVYEDEIFGYIAKKKGE